MIHHGDVLDVLPTLPDGAAQMCVTSPPYWGLRDYGVPPSVWPAMAYTPLFGLEPIAVPAMTCALGLEPDTHAFLAHLVHVFRQVHRILRADGTLWLNLGDTANASGGKGAGGQRGTGHRLAHVDRPMRALAGLPAKNLHGLPWRLALALQADGWILRQDIIWHKRTPMPETVSDRPTRAHEYLFLFAKQRHYHYDASAIAEPVSADTHARYAQPTPPKGYRGLYAEHPEIKPPHRQAKRKAHKVPSGWDTSEGGHRDLAGRYAHAPRHKNNPSFDAAMLGEKRDTRNKRSVWTLGPEPFRGAHFATFPTSLVRPCILAGSRPGDVVLDPFMGSGTTAQVAVELGRDYLGVELSPANVDMARERATTTQGLALA